MSLLNVRSNPFLPIFLTPTASLTPPTASPTPLTGIRLTPCATPLWSGPSGHLADPIPNTGHEPKFCIDVSSEHTPINLSTRNLGFQQSSTRRSPLPRILIYLDIPSRVPTLLKLGSLGTSLTKVSADNDSVACRTSIKETCAKRDRDQDVVQTFRDRQILHEILERKADLAVRGEKLAQRKIFEAEAEVEARNWEIEIQILLFLRSIRSSNDSSYNMRINGLIRLKETKKACMDYKKWGVSSSEKIMQEIAKKLKNWEEFVVKKQIEQDKQEVMNCLCIKRGILTVSPLLTQVQDYRTK